MAAVAEAPEEVEVAVEVAAVVATVAPALPCQITAECQWPRLSPPGELYQPASSDARVVVPVSSRHSSRLERSVYVERGRRNENRHTRCQAPAMLGWDE